MNTKIHYLYRDADNYKQHNEFVVRGEMTENDIDSILSCLYEGEYFVPELVGLPCERFTDYTEADHPFCELDETSFEPTDEEPTEVWSERLCSWEEGLSAEELVDAFEKAAEDGWEATVLVP